MGPDPGLGGGGALRMIFGDPMVMMVVGILCLILGVVLVACRLLADTGKSPRIIVGFAVFSGVALLSLFAALPPLIIVVSGLTFAVFFGLTIGITVQILYYLRCIPLEDS